MYFYLEVDRIDAESVGAFYYPLGTEPGDKLVERFVRRLEVYRRQGFQIIHFEKRLGYKEATRSDGVTLKLTIVHSKQPMELGANVGWEGDDACTTLH
jgi:hypothetical protein